MIEKLIEDCNRIRLEGPQCLTSLMFDDNNWTAMRISNGLGIFGRGFTQEESLNELLIKLKDVA